MLRIAVCDDDIVYLNSVLKPLLSEALSAAELRAEIRFFTDGTALIDEFRAHNGYDTVILDIDMPAIDGKALAEALRQLDGKFSLAFLTAYSGEAINTIPFSVKAFIPKSYSKAKILSALSKLFADSAAEQKKFTVFEIVKNGECGLVRLDNEDIFFFQNRSEHVYLHTKNESLLLTEKSLKRLAARYDLTGFCRIHTDLIVNIGRVYEIMKTDIVLTNGVKLPVSRRRRSELIAAFAELMTIKAGK